MRKQVDGALGGTDLNTKINSISEAQQEIKNFNDAKRTINEMLRYSKSITASNTTNAEQLAEMKLRALAAINHLFDDTIQPNKSTF